MLDSFDASHLSAIWAALVWNFQDFFFLLKVLFEMWICGCHDLIQHSTEVIVELNAEIHKVSLLFTPDLLTCTKIPVTLQPSCILNACVHLVISTFSIVTVFLGNFSYWHVAFIFNSVCMILHKCVVSCIRCLPQGAYCIQRSQWAFGVPPAMSLQ